MNLRAIQREQLHIAITESKLNSSHFLWDAPAKHLPDSLPPALLDGVIIKHTSSGYFFCIGQPWHLYWSPDVEAMLSEVKVDSDWNIVIGRFRGWVAHLAREISQQIRWPETTLPEHALWFLQHGQLDQLYDIVAPLGVNLDACAWTGELNQAKLCLGETKFFFRLSRPSELPGRGPFTASYSPGPVTNSAEASDLNWRGCLDHFGVWVAAVGEDLAAEQRLITQELSQAVSHPSPVVNALPSGEVYSELPVPRFEFLEEIGSGGFGIVIKIRDTQIGKFYALKRLCPHPFNAQDDEALKRAYQRFLRESKILLELNHPSIIRLFDVDFSSNTPEIRMEYVPWPSLQKLQAEEGTFSCERALAIITEISEALQYAYEEQQVLHRDLKPSNVLIHPQSAKVKVIDFGMGTFREDALGENPITVSSDTIGPGPYASPRFLKQPKLRVPAVDIYALGTIWAEMLVGTIPPRSRLSEILAGLGVDESAVHLIEWCLSEDESATYSDLSERLRSLISVPAPVRSGPQPKTRIIAPPPSYSELLARAEKAVSKCGQLASEYRFVVTCLPIALACIDETELDNIARAASRHRHLGWPIGVVLPKDNLPYPVQGGLEFKLSHRDFHGNERFDFWHLHQSGQFFMLRSGDQVQVGVTEAVDYLLVTLTVIELVEYLQTLSEEIRSRDLSMVGYQVKIELQRVEGLPALTLVGNRMPENNFPCQVEDIIVERSWSLDSTFEDSKDSEILSVLNEIFRYFRLAATPDDLEMNRRRYLKIDH